MAFARSGCSTHGLCPFWHQGAPGSPLPVLANSPSGAMACMAFACSGSKMPMANSFLLRPMSTLAPWYPWPLPTLVLWCQWPTHAWTRGVARQPVAHGLGPNSPCCCSIAQSNVCSICPNSDPQTGHQEAAGDWGGCQSLPDICHSTTTTANPS